MMGVFKAMAKEEADIEDVMYVSPAGPIKAVDIVYGLASFIEKSNNDFMCHKNGFSPKSLGNTLFENGFEHLFVGATDFEITAYAFKNKPSDEYVKLLNLSYQGHHV